MFVPSCATSQLTLDLISSHGERTHIFTDASVTSAGSMCTYVVPGLSVKKATRLSHCTSSTGAEHHGVLMALQFIEYFIPPRAWAIFTDTKPGLEALCSILVSDCLAPVVQEAIRTCHCATVNGHDIVLQ